MVLVQAGKLAKDVFSLYIEIQVDIGKFKVDLEFSPKIFFEVSDFHQNWPILMALTRSNLN